MSKGFNLRFFMADSKEEIVMPPCRSDIRYQAGDFVRIDMEPYLIVDVKARHSIDTKRGGERSTTTLIIILENAV